MSNHDDNHDNYDDEMATLGFGIEGDDANEVTTFVVAGPDRANIDVFQKRMADRFHEIVQAEPARFTFLEGIIAMVNVICGCATMWNNEASSLAEYHAIRERRLDVAAALLKTMIEMPYKGLGEASPVTETVQ